MCAVHPEIDATFVCSRCGSFGCEGCAFSRIEKREVCNACAAKGLGKPVPWEQRKELGFFRAFWQTVKLASRSPTAFFRTPATDASLFMPVLHGTLSYSVGLVLTYVVLGLGAMVSGGAVAALGDDQMYGPLAGFLGAYGCGLVGMAPIGAILSIPGTVFSTVVAAGLSHATLAIFGKSKASFEDTLRAVSYANAPYVWAWIPLVGGLISYVWMIWISVIAVRETHRCGTDWAVLATLGFRVILFFLLMAFYAAIFVFAFAAGSMRN